MLRRDSLGKGIAAAGEAGGVNRLAAGQNRYHGVARPQVNQCGAADPRIRRPISRRQRVGGRGDFAHVFFSQSDPVDLLHHLGLLAKRNPVRV